VAGAAAPRPWRRFLVLTPPPGPGILLIRERDYRPADPSRFDRAIVPENC
jgi:hypothetical protein